ncbi:MAG: Txe/YoeB family addiction module toxin [Lachnospiraceae bacterium]|nr:Txe/YoeB family addiction module toxin [Lachnospiraceae bacterium]
MYLIRFSRQADKDKRRLKGAGLDKKAKELLNIIEEDPFQNSPPYEGLVGNLSGYYSRRINLQHRLVYHVISEKVIYNDRKYEGTIKVDRMWSHYEKMK